MNVVDHNIVWLDVSVHDPHTVAVVQSSEQLIEIVSDVIVSELLVEGLKGGRDRGSKRREGEEKRS